MDLISYLSSIALSSITFGIIETQPKAPTPTFWKRAGDFVDEHPYITIGACIGTVIIISVSVYCFVQGHNCINTVDNISSVGPGTQEAWRFVSNTLGNEIKNHTTLNTPVVNFITHCKSLDQWRS